MAEESKVEDVRSFIGPDEKEYKVVAPNANDIREADWNYSRTFTRSLTEGITTSAEMMDILRRRGIVGPEFEQRAAELTAQLNQAIWDLEISDDMAEKRDQAVKVAELRDELFQWNQRLNGPMANTCEQLADDARLEYLTSCMVVNDKGDRVWDDYESYLKEKNQALALKSRFEIMLYLQGLDSDFLEKTPEAQAMREVETDILAKAEEAAKALEAVEAEEKKAKEAPKKKRTYKRKTTAKKTTKKEEPAE
jgi:hypothetical protein